jgi:hypothetical protein
MSSTFKFKDAIFTQPADEIINQIPDTRIQDHDQITTCLLGGSQGMPDVSADDETGDKTCWWTSCFVPSFTDPCISSIPNPNEHNKG